MNVKTRQRNQVSTTSQKGGNFKDPGVLDFKKLLAKGKKSRESADDSDRNHYPSSESDSSDPSYEVNTRNRSRSKSRRNGNSSRGLKNKDESRKSPVKVSSSVRRRSNSVKKEKAAPAFLEVRTSKGKLLGACESIKYPPFTVTRAPKSSGRRIDLARKQREKGEKFDKGENTQLNPMLRLKGPLTTVPLCVLQSAPAPNELLDSLKELMNLNIQEVKLMLETMKKKEEQQTIEAVISKATIQTGNHNTFKKILKWTMRNCKAELVKRVEKTLGVKLKRKTREQLETDAHQVEDEEAEDERRDFPEEGLNDKVQNELEQEKPAAIAKGTEKESIPSNINERSKGILESLLGECEPFFLPNQTAGVQTPPKEEKRGQTASSTIAPSPTPNQALTKLQEVNSSYNRNVVIPTPQKESIVPDSQANVQDQSETHELDPSDSETNSSPSAEDEDDDSMEIIEEEIKFSDPSQEKSKREASNKPSLSNKPSISKQEELKVKQPTPEVIKETTPEKPSAQPQQTQIEMEISLEDIMGCK